MTVTTNWRQDLRVAAAGWIEARIYVAAAYAVTLAVIDHLDPAAASYPVDDGLLPWDGAWYRDLANSGYGAPGLEGGIRFFPLWPLLGRVLGAGRPDIALVVAANLLALLAGMLMHRLALQETDDAEASRQVVRVFSLFPSAFVLVLGYSEALFLTLGIGFVLCARARNWWATALLGFGAGLTRPVGALLALPAAVRAARSDPRSPAAWLAVVSAPLGTLCFLGWAERTQGGWRVPIEPQTELRGSSVEPITRIIRALIDGARGDAGELLHGGAAVILVILLVVSVRRLSTDLWVYAAASTLLILAVENLNSMERYALAAFPLVIAARVASSAPVLRRWLPTASAVAMTTLTILALSGVYVP